MALSALHLVHGWLPSHFDFFRRHLSQALPTRFLILSVESEEDVLRTADGGMVCSIVCYGVIEDESNDD
jgi:hypothetical protein